MSLSQAQILHQQAIYAAKRKLEEPPGHPKEDKIVEWALLDIVETLSAIHMRLVLSNVPKIGMQK
jgi:hypothetical protein